MIRNRGKKLLVPSCSWIPNHRVEQLNFQCSVQFSFDLCIPDLFFHQRWCTWLCCKRSVAPSKTVALLRADRVGDRRRGNRWQWSSVAAVDIQCRLKGCPWINPAAPPEEVFHILTGESVGLQTTADPPSLQNVDKCIHSVPFYWQITTHSCVYC